jgi:hypothetical protein
MNIRMTMMRQTTDPTNVIPLAELSILELVFAQRIPSPSILKGPTGMCQLLYLALATRVCHR